MMNVSDYAIHLGRAGVTRLRRLSLGSQQGFDEAWLQRQLFEQPGLVPVARIDAGADAFVPIAMEFALPGEQCRLRVDILGVTPAGKLVLVECKLWRNPEARREVIGQILDYASILARWSYGDLEAHLKRTLGWSGVNPLYRHVCRHFGAVDEADFVDGMARSLERGEFLLVIAGDGIRADAHRIVHQLERQGGLASRLALLEVGLWMDEAGGVLLMPTLSARTEVITHRVVADAAGRPLGVAPDADEDVAVAGDPVVLRAGPSVQSPAVVGKRAANRRFWQQFIDTVEIDHPEQARPQHAVNNAVRMPLPSPGTALTLYRAETENAMGAFMRLRGEAGREVHEALRDDPSLRAEISEALGTEPLFQAGGTSDQQEYKITVRHPLGTAEGATEAQQTAWLQRAANAMVNALRPRLERLAAERSR